MEEGRESGEAQGWAGGNPLAEQHAAHRERLKQLKDIVAKETDPRIQIWIRVKWGGERAMDVGRELGYRDGSGVLQVIKRLEHPHADPRLRATLAWIRNEVSGVES